MKPFPFQRTRACEAILLLVLLLLKPAPLRADPPQPSVIIVIGAAGAEQYSGVFAEAAHNWEKAAAAGHAKSLTLGLEAKDEQVREKLREALQKETAGQGDLWLVLIGHGTFDGREGRFNVRGDDFGPTDLAAWLQPVKRPTAVVATFASSGAFLKPLAAPGRIVLAATRSGSEENYSRLGKYLAEAIADPAADLDQDGQTSLLEGWLTAAQRVTAFYKGEGRLATEHSLLDDNGDGFGTPADWFKGTRAVKKAQANAQSDGLHAHQLHLLPSPAEIALAPEIRAARDRLEQQLSALREHKATMMPEEYYRELEALLVQIAQVYEPVK